MTSKNCRNCAFNEYESVGMGEDPEEMTNNCYHPEIQREELYDNPVGIGAWMQRQIWDDELLCPEHTPTACPGFREKS